MDIRLLYGRPDTLEYNSISTETNDAHYNMTQTK